eukprot:1512079-Ditylum_brightwellii.AAC.1
MAITTTNAKIDKRVPSVLSEIGRAYNPPHKLEQALYLFNGVHIGYCRSVVLWQKGYLQP